MATYGKKRVLSPRSTTHDFDAVIDNHDRAATASGKAKFKPSVPRRGAAGSYGFGSSSSSSSTTSGLPGASPGSSKAGNGGYGSKGKGRGSPKSSSSSSAVASPPRFPRSPGGGRSGASAAASATTSGSRGRAAVAARKLGTMGGSARSPPASPNLKRSGGKNGAPAAAASSSLSSASSPSFSSRLIAASSSKPAGTGAGAAKAPRSSPRTSPVKRPKSSGGTYGKRPPASAAASAAAAALAEAGKASKRAAAALARTRKAAPSATISVSSPSPFSFPPAISDDGNSCAKVASTAKPSAPASTSPRRRSGGATYGTKRVPAPSPRVARVAGKAAKAAKTYGSRKRARVVRPSGRKLGGGSSIDYDNLHAHSGGRSARESGRNQQHTDEIEYLLEGLALGQPASVRIPSLLKLGQQAASRDFRQHLKAHGYLSKVFALLADAHGDELMSIVTSAVIVVLVRDGRAGGLEQDGLVLLTKLFSAKRPAPPTSTGGSSILARKKRQLRLRQKAQVVEKVKAMLDHAKLQHPFAELSAIDTKALALEAIGSLMNNKGRQLETVQNEIRLSGCLEKIAIAVHESIESLAATAGLPKKAAFVRLERHLRALNGAVSGNTSNQSYLVCMVDALLLKALKKLVRLFEVHASMLTHPAPPQPAQPTALLASADAADAAARAAGLGSPPKPTVASKSSPRKSPAKRVKVEPAATAAAVAAAKTPVKPAPRSDVEDLLGECICETFNALLAMTNDNELGCRTFGSEGSLEQVARLSMEHAGKFLVHRHDVMSLGIAVLINLTEHNAENRAALPKATVARPPRARSRGVGGVACTGDGRAALTSVLSAIFVESSATLEERGISKDDVGSVQEQTFENIAGAYVAILMGCLCVGNEENVAMLRQGLPGQKFETVVLHLGDYIYFQQAAGVGQSDTKSVQKLMQVLKDADGIREEDDEEGDDDDGEGDGDGDDEE
eukprot:gene1191-32552_t